MRGHSAPSLLLLALAIQGSAMAGESARSEPRPEGFLSAVQSGELMARCPTSKDEKSGNRLPERGSEKANSPLYPPIIA